MERADGNRKLWLLKSTSGHNRPERLAAAVALGILAGLVPKLNLLAVILYGLILILPVHTLLAVAISIGVALLSFQLDAAAHSVGQWLLSQASLRALWSSLERAPLVPWMSLHNTVVLGHLVIGTALLAPIYMISLRIFERLEYGERSRKKVRQPAIQAYAPVTTEEAEPLTTKKESYPQRDGTPERRRSQVPQVPQPHESTVDRSPLIIPPPKLNRSVADSSAGSHLSAPDEPILFEPISDAQRVNAWHMHRAAGESQMVPIGAKPDASSESARVAASNGRPVESTKLSSDEFFPQMSGARSTDQKNSTGRDYEINQLGLPPAPQRVEGIASSLLLAQQASDVLAWVDDLLDECMSEEGMTLVPQTYEALCEGTSQSATTADTDSVHTGDKSAQQRWLLETTIEIVRLADDTMPDQLPDPRGETEPTIGSQSPASLSETRSKENTKIMPAQSMTRAWPNVGSVSTPGGAMATPVPVQDLGEPTILNLNHAAGRSSVQRAGFQQLVMAGVHKEEPPQATLPIEPVKGECLANLLGHLRQTREGKST